MAMRGRANWKVFKLGGLQESQYILCRGTDHANENATSMWQEGSMYTCTRVKDNVEDILHCLHWTLQYV